ncbi:hypothetical protein P7C70_g5663, partial [Phenoliferia sp. Uapishka_3]
FPSNPLFPTSGYKIALISRTPSSLTAFAETLNAAHGADTAAAFPVTQYTVPAIRSAFEEIEKVWPTVEGKSGIRFALWNAGSATWGGFLGITEDQIQESVDVNIVGAFAFGQEVVKAILKSTGEEEVKEGHRGSLLFTGATAALRGGNGFSAFAAGKFGIRAIAQSIAREFGPQGIHSAHGAILNLLARGCKLTQIVTDRGLERSAGNEAATARYQDPRVTLLPDSIAKAYLYLHEQDSSAWTQELDLRPSFEKF